MSGLKNAIIIPLIKELNSKVNNEDFKNYRTVSNLQFLGKLIERVVDSRLQDHFLHNNLHSDHQFGYKKQHSTETFLLKITDNLLNSCDKNMDSVVLLLDLSAAIDTVDHQKLLHMLQYDYGIVGTALKWFKSFLTGRTFKVKVGGYASLLEILLFGVAQGSVLGPRLFNMYT